MALESFIRDGVDKEYAVEFLERNGYTVVGFNPVITSMLSDMAKAVPKEEIATQFHNTIASVIRSLVAALSKSRHLTDVALSGGTFQNQYLLNRTVRLLAADGMNVYINRKVPCNDGGVSLGQAYLVRERLKKSDVRS